ncbi:MAG TPA: hypothetical protein VL652_27690 [Kutzneria sp.]|nr:hypothetical protein [Kutzneria sp.]
MTRALLRIMLAVLGGILALGSLTPAVANAALAPDSVRPAAATEQDLGGQTLNEYCQAGGFTKATQHSSGAWTCDTFGASAALDLTAACQWQFSDLVVAGFAAYSRNGHCKTLASSAGRISDLNSIGQYCQALGYVKATANAANVVKNTVTSWRCVDNSNGQDGIELVIDLHAACQWANPAAVNAGEAVVSYFPNVGAYLGITCIGIVA